MSHWASTGWINTVPKWVEDTFVVAASPTGGGKTHWQLQQEALNRRIKLDDDSIALSVIRAFLFMQ